MEPLTHTLVGAALARTRLGRVTPLAGPALLVGANLPDVDVASYLAGADAAFGFRRGWTHGPLALALLPLIWTVLLVLFDRRRAGVAPHGPRARPGRLLALSGLACLTHPLLDWLNTYGIRLLMPFDARWFYGDSLFIVDPWVWLLLGGGVFLSRPGRRVGPGWFALAALTSATIAIAHARLPPAAPALWLAGLLSIAWLDRRRAHETIGPLIERATRATLPATALYIVALVTLSMLGASWVRAELTRQGIHDAGRVMLGPSVANPGRWELVAETPRHYHRGAMRWWPRRRLELDRAPIDRPPETAVVRAALADPRIAGAVGWMRFPYVEVDANGDGWIVHVIDARYARSRRDRFGVASVRLDRELAAGALIVRAERRVRRT